MSSRTAHSPHVHGGVSTALTMWTVALALVPACAWGVFAFGPHAAWIVLSAVAASMLTEVVAALLERRGFTLADGSAALTGLLVGMAMPPTVPLYVPITAAVVATGVAKWAFGGLGANWVNPALAGWLVVFFSWPDAMSRWVAPSYWGAADAVSSATALVSPDLVATGGVGLGSRMTEAFGRLLGGGGGHATGVANLLVGNRAGAVGEVSALLLIGAIVALVVRRIVPWRIPVTYIAAVALLTWILGDEAGSVGPLFRGDVAVGVLGGGLLLGATMASDPVTSPFAPAGMILYALGCALVTVLVRKLGVYAEGVAFAVVIMNMVVPTINRLTQRRGRTADRGQEG